VTSARYYRRLIDIFISYKKKRTLLPYPPLRLWVEPTSHCTLRCVMCPNKELAEEDKGFMDLGLFQKVIDEAAGFAHDVHLYHRGEALLHPQFFEMARYAHQAGLKTELHTNATVLDEEKARALIASGLDDISFSFDGYDKESYESIRINGSFEKTVGNILRFLEIKKELKSKTPVAILELIDFPDLYSRIDPAAKKAFLDRFKGLPLDRLIVKEMHNWAGEVGGLKTSRHFSPCTFLWQALIVLWDGTVLPCTQDFFGYYKLGNVRDAALVQIWNNERAVRLREKMVGRDIRDLETCSKCDRVRRKQFFGVPREYLWKFLFNKMS